MSTNTESLDVLLESFYRDDESEFFNLELAEHIVATYPEAAQSHAALARAYCKLQENDAAATHLRDALRIDPQHPDVLRVKAYLLEAVDQNLQEANRVLDSALAKYPNHYGCLLARGYSAVENGKHDVGANLLLRAVKARPDYRRAFTNLTHFCSEHGASNTLFVDTLLAAVKLIESYRKLDGEQLYNLGTGLYQIDRYAEAIVYLDRARTESGEQNAIQHNRALCLEKLERYQDAIDEWSLLLEREPEWDWPIEGRVRCNRTLGNIDAAMADIERLSALDPNNQNGRRYHAGILYDQEKYTLSLAVLDTLLADHPDYDIALVLRGQCHVHLNQTSKARADFQRAIEIDEAYFLAHYHLAKLELAEGRNDESLTHAEISISLDPNDWDGRALRAKALSALGREAEANRMYESWIETHPDDSVAFEAYAAHLIELKRWQPALALLERALDPLKSHPYRAWSIGECHKGLGNLAAAREWCQKAKTSYALEGNKESADICERSVQGLVEKKGLFSRLFG
jgi:tetratricopeptide (TPR) repeat protein